MEPIKSSRLVTGGLLAVAISLTLPAIAHADHGGSGSSLTNRDNNDHDFDSNSLEPESQLACSHGKSQMGSQTEVRVAVGSSDVHCFDADYGNTTWVGTTSCTSLTWNHTRCDQYRINFNTHHIISNNLWKSAGCHEVGHTSSVGHRTAASDPNSPYSCMRAAVGSNRTTYDSHDITEINNDA
jgi:hypothetical protein